MCLRITTILELIIYRNEYHADYSSSKISSYIQSSSQTIYLVVNSSSATEKRVTETKLFIRLQQKEVT